MTIHNQMTNTDEYRDIHAPGFIVADEAERLALTNMEVFDLCLQEDTNIVYVYGTDDSWHEMGSGSSGGGGYPSFMRALVPPDLDDFTWVNQETGTATEENDAIYLLAPAAAGDDHRILKKAAPSTPYHIIVAVLPMLYKDANYPSVGIGFRESSSGKLSNLLWGYGDYMIAAKFTNFNTYSAAYATTIVNAPRPLWFRIGDDGSTNRTYDWSCDGNHWFNLHTVGRTDYLTADEVYMFANSNNASYPSAGLFISWEEEES